MAHVKRANTYTYTHTRWLHQETNNNNWSPQIAWMTQITHKREKKSTDETTKPYEATEQSLKYDFNHEIVNNIKWNKYKNTTSKSKSIKKNNKKNV